MKLWLLALSLLAFELIGPATAAPVRYAVVIGANYGDLSDPPLTYAEHDAARVAEVLGRLGGVDQEHVILLRSPTVGEVDRVMSGLGARITAARAAGDEPVLFVYYSGHADAGGLHMGGAHLSFAHLKEMATAATPEVSVFIVDACRSGGLTRVKGAMPADPFEMKVEDRLDSAGVAIITSSAVDEEAQESERLKGGVFTHHLLNGLLGAADASRDDVITLSEAYRYAYAQTLRATSSTRYVQHPTYAFQMRGREELVLTRLSGRAGLGRMRFQSPGRYVVLGDTEGRISELMTEGPTDMLVSAGGYLVRRRGSEAVYEAQIDIPSGGVGVVQADRMSRRPYGQTVRKGTLDRSYVMSVSGGAEIGAAPLDGLSTGLYGTLGLQLDLQSVTLQGRLRYGATEGANADLALAQQAWGLDLGAYKVFDVISNGGFNLGMGLGVRLGADLLTQRFAGSAEADDRQQVTARAAPVARLEIAPTAGLLGTLDCGVDTWLIARPIDTGAERYDVTPTPFCSLGLGIYLP
ncbi:MAG: caspase domain-containing protein [Bradymonadia bacterium]